MATSCDNTQSTRPFMQDRDQQRRRSRVVASDLKINLRPPNVLLRYPSEQVPPQKPPKKGKCEGAILWFAISFPFFCVETIFGSLLAS